LRHLTQNAPSVKLGPAFGIREPIQPEPEVERGHKSRRAHHQMELCRAESPEPEGYEARRLVLEGLLDLRVSLDGEEVTITGKLPVPAATGEKNCVNRIRG
jgi:hypothetical protein